MSHINDIRNWLNEGLPIAAHWNTGGFPFDWHVEKVKAGNRFIPSIKYNILPSNEPNSAPPPLKPENETFLRDNGIPICIRTDNIPTNFTASPRLPEVPESIPLSPLVWSINASGTVEDQAICDPFADVNLWKTMGEKWGSTNYMAKLQTRFPNAQQVILADNNESNYDSYEKYFDATLDAYGKYATDKDGIRVYKWKPLDALMKLSIRTAELSKTLTPKEYVKLFSSNRVAQYKALYSGFNSKLTAYNGKLYTEGYKISGQTLAGGMNIGLERYNFCGAGQLYVSAGQLADYTSSDYFKVYNTIPRFEAIEQENDGRAREIFLSFSGGAAYTGLINGEHDFISPELYSNHIQWLMWSLKGNKRPLLLRYWIGNATKPTSPIFSDAAKITLANLGKSEYANLTEEDYFGAVLKSVNLVCENPILRDFWQNGTVLVTGKHPENEILPFSFSVPIEYPPKDFPDNRWRLLECNLNTSRKDMVLLPGPNSRGCYNPNISIKVWSVAIELRDQILVYAWSPCKLDGQMTLTVPGFGDITVDVPKNSVCYLLTKEKERIIQTTVIDPKKIERLL